MTTSQFHLAFPVRDLEAARAFYIDTIGCKQGRETSNHIDFDMFGHHIVAHLVPTGPGAAASEFDGHEVPVPHFGLNLERVAWAELAERLKRSRCNFREYPHARLVGQLGEHDTLFVYDPSGNALEFKSFRNPAHVFAQVHNRGAFPASEVRLETPMEYIAKRIWHRAASFTAQDVFDFACVVEREPAALQLDRAARAQDPGLGLPSDAGLGPLRQRREEQVGLALAGRVGHPVLRDQGGAVRRHHGRAVVRLDGAHRCLRGVCAGRVRRAAGTGRGWLSPLLTRTVDRTVRLAQPLLLLNHRGSHGLPGHPDGQALRRWGRRGGRSRGRRWRSARTGSA
jgi:extradiol dioxygenase family protein